jgi:hypothetical protein
MLGGSDKGDVGKRMKEKPRPACRSYKPNRAQHLTHLPGGQFSSVGWRPGVKKADKPKEGER